MFCKGIFGKAKALSVVSAGLIGGTAAFLRTQTAAEAQGRREMKGVS